MAFPGLEMDPKPYIIVHGQFDVAKLTSKAAEVAAPVNRAVFPGYVKLADDREQQEVGSRFLREAIVLQAHPEAQTPRTE